MITRFHHSFMTVLLCGVMLLSACSNDDSSPSGPDDGNTTALETKSASIGTDGGSISLSNGASVIFPAGAVESTGSYTVKHVDPDLYGEGDPDVSRVVIECSGDDTTFDEPVEIRVPLPEGMSEADSTMVFGGYIDEESGTKEMVACSIEMVGGKPVAVLPVEHFSIGFLEWMFGKIPPPNAGPHDIPYYGQGESPYCWAASLQMVSQAAGFDTRNEITDIIGKMEVDESGISSIQFRTSSTISSIIKSRTGVTPDRCAWDGINYRVMKDYLKRELGVRGYPVALHSSVWAHAVVVVGYSGDTFYIHDPASTSDSAIGYTPREWSNMVDGMGSGEFMVCLSIPKSLDSSRSLITANLMNSAFQINKRYSDGDPVSRIYKYRWDFTNGNGYSLFDIRDQKPAGVLPGEVINLTQGGDIEIVNASRTIARDVSIWLDIACISQEGIFYTEDKRMTLPANSTTMFRFTGIPVDIFRYNAKNTSTYSLVVRAMADGSVVDEAAVEFEIESRPIKITGIEPSSGAPGTNVVLRGSGFGSLPEKAAVKFGGITAKVDTSGWSDTMITAIVPEGASTGPITVTIDEIDGSSDTFTVAEEMKESNTITYKSKSRLDLTINVTYTLTGKIETSRYSNTAVDYYYHEIAIGTPAILEFEDEVIFGQYVYSVEEGDETHVYTYYDPEMLPLDYDLENGRPLNMYGEYNYAIDKNSVSFTFNQYNNKLYVDLIYRMKHDLKVYNKDGELIREEKGVNSTIETFGILSIAPI